MTKFSRALVTFTAIPILAAAVAAVADEERGTRAERRAELMKRYDADGDGRLSRKERRAARDVRRVEQRHHADGEASSSASEPNGTRVELRRARDGRGSGGGTLETGGSPDDVDHGSLEVRR